MSWFGPKPKKHKTRTEKRRKRASDFEAHQKQDGRHRRFSPGTQHPLRSQSQTRQRIPLEFTLRRIQDGKVQRDDFMQKNEHQSHDFQKTNRSFFYGGSPYQGYAEKKPTPFAAPTQTGRSAFCDTKATSTGVSSAYGGSMSVQKHAITRVDDAKNQKADVKKTEITQDDHKENIKFHRPPKTPKARKKEDNIRAEDRQAGEFLNYHTSRNAETVAALFTFPERPKPHLASDKAGEKCRFDDIHCNDCSRVELQNGGFIHANKLNLPDQKEIILTQKPLKDTVNDFWDMIWQEKVYAVLMILTEEEMLREKVDLLPQKRAGVFGDQILVNLQLESQAHDDLKLTVLGLTKGNETRHLRWLTYSSWEYNQCPNEQRLWEIQSYLRKCNRPVIVVSLAGVGRASSYFLFELLHQQIHSHSLDGVNMDKIVSYIRSQRQASLQSPLQIEFIANMVIKHFKRKKQRAGRAKTDDENEEV
ncbi:unnamed protein product [Bursaphelenchus xylophilus]|uniref:(pine wood nematode) hypothetical protein n=1 Tax=Bursaphelenchus xylophilus TaxID=6326 RepID=A0A1I7SDT6_BURXY|nr:unnamed protein product [Bursaphelenchus xylophilus]CAG9084300.1 unnamed protein product [Bursaphelenchus xylophilus]